MGLKREIDLSDVEVEAILRTAEAQSERDYLFLELIGEARGIRIGEVVGVQKQAPYTRWVDRREHSKGRETIVSHTHLPGLYPQDFKEGAAWFHRKGGYVKKILLPVWLYERLLVFAGTRKGKKLFNFGERQGYNLVQQYAREAGLKDWMLVHPHRLRHYFITRADRKFPGQIKTVQHLAGHATWKTTLRYIGKLTPEEEAAKLEELVPTSATS